MLRIKLLNPQGSEERLRTELEGGFPTRPERIATSIDLPLSADAAKVLSCAAKEADGLNHRSIDSAHLVLGIFAMNGKAAEALAHQGVSYDGYREALAGQPEPSAPPAPHQPPPATPASAPDAFALRKTAAPSLREPVSKLEQLVEHSSMILAGANENFGYQRLKRKPWTRKEALGHLIDWAAAHHQWLARALAEPRLAADGYPDATWVPAQRYPEVSWSLLQGLWASLNRLLVHVLAGVPEEKLNTPCRIGIAPPCTLRELIDRYVAYCEDIVGQILAHG